MDNKGVGGKKGDEGQGIGVNVRDRLLAWVRSCTSKVGMQERLKRGAFVDSWLL